MNTTAERLATFSLTKERPLPEVAHFPYINDCQNLLESNEPFTPEDKSRFARNLLILSNSRHKDLYSSKPGAISGTDNLGNYWSFSIQNKTYRNGWSLEFYFEEALRELVLGQEGKNTIYNYPIEEGFWTSAEEVDDVSAKQWLGKALEVALHAKEQNSKIRYDRAQYEHNWHTRFRK